MLGHKRSEVSARRYQRAIRVAATERMLKRTTPRKATLWPTLHNVLSVISGEYHDIPFHNQIHGADIAQTMHWYGRCEFFNSSNGCAAAPGQCWKGEHKCFLCGGLDKGAFEKGPEASVHCAQDP